MNCLDPYVTSDSAFPCGKCPSCVSRRRRVWAHRIMLEAAQWPENCFCTLTYAPEVCPDNLDRVALQLFLKRLRDRWKSGIRYFACGEYSPSGRPHYHLALFNYPMCSLIQTPIIRGNCPCTPCSVVRESWGFGHILLGSLESRSAAYIAGYVLKKMNSPAQKLLPGRIPEFVRMSLKPGIGAAAMWDVASVVMSSRKASRQEDVPQVLRHGMRQLPLGPYLRRKLRERVGREPGAPQASLEAARAPLRGVFEYAKAYAPPSVRREVVKAYVGEWNAQLNRNIAARSVRRETI